MSKWICHKCMEVYDNSRVENRRCPSCGSPDIEAYHFSNSDAFLSKKVPMVIEERKRLGLEGLVGGLQAVIINTEPDRLKTSAEELQRYTGLAFDGAFEDEDGATCVLRVDGSADFLVRARKGNHNPFAYFNTHRKSAHLPNTRLETFVFKTTGLEKYVEIQRQRGVAFMTRDIVRRKNYSFIQTMPSRMTGNSLGFIQWHGKEGNYSPGLTGMLDWTMEKPDRPYLRSIKELDHTATRMAARDRDAAIIEFMELTNYNFEFAIYVRLFNSITSVARLSGEGYAAVFTSGIFPYISDEISGPTEKFVENYGTRVHHIAFNTDDIEKTYDGLARDGLTYMIALVGSREEGLKQTFTNPSPNTLLVNEYIHRYDGFDGFFTRSNVTHLTGATDRQ